MARHPELDSARASESRGRQATMVDSFSILRARYLQWSIDTFGECAAFELDFDEAGFPDWSDVESSFADLLNSGSLRDLNELESSALLFLIARSWDLGRMIAWLSTSDTMSNLGELTDADAIFLAQRVLTLEGAEYDDARYQIAAVLPRARSARSRAIELLVLFHDSPHEYTQRIALRSLTQMRAPDVLERVEHAAQAPDSSSSS